MVEFYTKEASRDGHEPRLPSHTSPASDQAPVSVRSSPPPLGLFVQVPGRGGQADVHGKGVPQTRGHHLYPLKKGHFKGIKSSLLRKLRPIYSPNGLFLIYTDYLLTLVSHFKRSREELFNKDCGTDKPPPTPILKKHVVIPLGVSTPRLGNTGLGFLHTARECPMWHPNLHFLSQTLLKLQIRT